MKANGTWCGDIGSCCSNHGHLMSTDTSVATCTFSFRHSTDILLRDLVPPLLLPGLSDTCMSSSSNPGPHKMSSDTSKSSLMDGPFAPDEALMYCIARFQESEAGRYCYPGGP